MPTIIQHYLDEGLENEDQYLLSDKILKNRFKVLAISTPLSTNSMCFTKAYTHYLEGTGSIYSSKDEVAVKKAFEPLEIKKTLDSDVLLGQSEIDVKDDQIVLDPVLQLKPLRLRFFTPKEVSRLMNFPENFSFPKEVTNKQRYRLLGNSINVAVVSELIKLLFSDVNLIESKNIER